MKLRLRGNSVRLRVNRREVDGLAAGASLEQKVHFPGEASFSYVLEASKDARPGASFRQGVIRISAPHTLIQDWATGDSIGIYFELPANGASLTVAIEKDLECVDGSPEERDPEAFPRSTRKNC